MILKIAKLLLKFRYRIEVRGFKEIEKKGCEKVLFLPNHPALIDPVILYTIIYERFRPKAVADYGQANRKGFKKIISKVKPIKIPDPKISGLWGYEIITKALKASASELKSGKNMLIYPSGKMTFTGLEDIGSNSGVEYLLRNVPDLRVVLIRTKGLWGSVFSRAKGKAPDVASFIPELIKVLILNLVFFIPKRDVTIEFSEPSDFPFCGTRLEINRYLENFYNKDFLPNTIYPYFFFRGNKPFIMEEPFYPPKKRTERKIPSQIKDKVYRKLGEFAGVDKEKIKSDYEISGDLGIDSLSMILFLEWTDEEFGNNRNFDLNGLVTVYDCCLVAVEKKF